MDRPDVARGDLRGETARTGSLTAQTPGLDATRPARDAAMRGAAWVRGRPTMLLGVLGGLLVAGVGAVLALRRARPGRAHLDRLRTRGADVYGRVRSRFV